MAVMDTVCFKRSCVYFVVRDWYSQKNIYLKRIKYETVFDCQEAISTLERKGFVVDGIVVDGRRGVLKVLSEKYSIQMCHFHQKQIIRRYLTNNPKTEAGKMLKEIVKMLLTTDEILFEFLLNFWYERYKSFIKEKTINPITKRWFYTHKRLRSTYRSLRNNFPYLFTFLRVKNMPNTTNSLDGFFGHLKDAVSIHRGLKIERKTKLIEYLIVR